MGGSRGEKFSIEEFLYIASIFKLSSDSAKEYFACILLDNPYLSARYFNNYSYPLVDIGRVGREIDDVLFKYGIDRFYHADSNKPCPSYFNSTDFVKMIVHRNHMNHLGIEFKSAIPEIEKPNEVLGLNKENIPEAGRYLQIKFLRDLNQLDEVIYEIFSVLKSGGIEKDEITVLSVAQLVYNRTNIHNKYVNGEHGKKLLC
jgi:hypothetical protein